MGLSGRRIAAALAVLALAGGAAVSAQRSEEPGAGADWAAHGGAADESGYSRLDQISDGTIGKLGLAWALDLPGEQVLQATPLAVDGVLYFTGSLSKVYAVDAASGKILWTHDPEIWRHQSKVKLFFPVNRGAAFAGGRLFAATLDGRLQALDPRTGKLLWSVETTAPDARYMVTGAPRTFGDKVIVGNGGGDYGSRGYVTAYDQATGRQLWRFYTVPGSPEQNAGDPAMEAAAKTWAGEYWKTGTGGTAWNGMTFDPELNRIYVGTGNAGPYDPAVRSPGDGDNLYLASIVALDADTGKYLWHYQENPREAWDYKATANIVAGTIIVDGKPRKVLMQSPTNGFFYVLDRETGKLISAEKTGKVTWAERIDLRTGRPVEMPDIRYETGETIMWPSPLGAHNWQDMAFSPKTGLVYIPHMQLGVRFVKNVGARQAGAGGISMAPYKADDQDATGTLLAWDPIAQKARWRVPHSMMWNGGTLATAGNLVFQGTADGWFSAYDAGSGKRLWRFDAGLGIISAPISYSAGGRQYVSVLVGYGSNTFGRDYLNAGWKFNAQPRRLLTFALGGKARLAPSAPPDFAVHALDDPDYGIDEAALPEARMLFTRNCTVCHGIFAVSQGAPAPDLRESAIALDRQALWTVVHDGALKEKGMPQFEQLTPDQVGKIQMYIRSAARAALGLRKADSDAPAGVKN